MTSEELELSLRAEFENYLKSTLEAIRQDVAEFQKNFEAEFAKHKSQMDEAVRAFSTRLETLPKLDRGFTESVTEHLRLAKDEGAKITAEAFGEAEKLKQEALPEVRYDIVRDAVSDIGSQLTQAAILRALVEHAEKFAPRGAFFIVRNEQFVGWKPFGSAEVSDEDTQAIRFAASSDSVLSKAVNSLSTTDSSYGANADDDLFLQPLGFGRPDRMYAIPLTARGRGVAVLYADYGTGGVSLNIEALETIVRVAGLTVELRATSHAAAQPAAEQKRPAEEQQAEAADDDQSRSAEQEFAAVPERVEEFPGAPSGASAPEPAEVVREASPEEEPAAVSEESEYTGAVVYEASESFPAEPAEAVYVAQVAEVSETEEIEDQPAAEYDFQPEAAMSDSGSDRSEASANVEFETVPDTTEFTYVEPAEEVQEYVPAIEEAAATPPVSEELTTGSNGHAAESVSQPAVETVGASQFKGRFADRVIDLPIDVPETERKLHNNARRFARLLVSEIKLYNEQKVVEGREAADLYDRLREAIDRSREMYDKRVEPQVAGSFDYFHYELVNSLADGDPVKLGSSYPGSKG